MFIPRILGHRERIDWDKTTHVKLKPGAVADTQAGERILQHIRARASVSGIAAVADLVVGFVPVRTHTTHLQSMRADLRHMGNLRESGEMSENKGLLELGTQVSDDDETPYPDEIPDDCLVNEGAKRRISINAYERDHTARMKCINAWGCVCVVCGFNFERAYGGRGAGFIHVHHLTPISAIGKEYKLDPISDLRPVCPNCHAIIHRANPALSVEEMRRIVEDMRQTRIRPDAQ